jgi:hypothetical protein
VGCLSLKLNSISRWVFVAFVATAPLNLRADGMYQRTEDHKAIVWNNNPQPGDAASWKGEHDDNGYATGYGTLTWYHLERKNQTGSNIPQTTRSVIATFSGVMTNGKLSGQVNTVGDDRKMLHAKFVDGRRVGPWSSGAAATAVAEKSEDVDEEKSTTVPPAKSETKPTTTEVAESEPAHPTDEVPAEGPLKVEPPKAAAPKIDAPKVEPAKPIVVNKRAEIETATVSKPVRPTEAKPTANISAPNEQIDDSLRSLIGPPPSIRVNAPPPQAPIPAPSLPPVELPEVATLSVAEVIGLADAEARTQGYDLGEYELPQVSAYDAKNDTWSVAYKQKGKANGRFTVSVIDKTRKTVLSK